jgi:hypothetical protein
MEARVREVSGGSRVYQLREPKNRHLCDVRQVDAMPDSRIIEGVRVVAPEVLAAMNAVSIVARATREKGLSDKLDLARLCRALPAPKDPEVAIAACAALGAGQREVDAWLEIARLELSPDDDE